MSIFKKLSSVLYCVTLVHVFYVHIKKLSIRAAVGGKSVNAKGVRSMDL